MRRVDEVIELTAVNFALEPSISGLSRGLLAAVTGENYPPVFAGFDAARSQEDAA